MIQADNFDIRFDHNALQIKDEMPFIIVEKDGHKAPSLKIKNLFFWDIGIATYI